VNKETARERMCSREESGNSAVDVISGATGLRRLKAPFLGGGSLKEEGEKGGAEKINCCGQSPKEMERSGLITWRDTVGEGHQSLLEEGGEPCLSIRGDIAVRAPCWVGRPLQTLGGVSGGIC